MPRTDLSDLLGALDRKDTAPGPTEVLVGPPALSDEHGAQSAPSTPSARQAAITRAAEDVADRSSRANLPLTRTFDNFERKEARLRPDQYEALTINARRLNKLKGTGGVRITENTLIRVALDLLIAHMPELRGSTEEELRSSLSL